MTDFNPPAGAAMALSQAALGERGAWPRLYAVPRAEAPPGEPAAAGCPAALPRVLLWDEADPGEDCWDAWGAPARRSAG